MSKAATPAPQNIEPKEYEALSNLYHYKEYLIRAIPHKDLQKNNTLIPILQETTQKTAKVYPIPNSCHGSTGSILVITNSHNKITTIEVVWKGAVIDYFLALGASCYQKIKEVALKLLNTIVQDHQFSQQITIGVSGHGLGGALAQYFFTDLVCIINKNSDTKYEDLAPNRSPSSLNMANIQIIELTAFNSVGVAEDTYYNAQECTEQFIKKGGTVKAYYSLSDGDLLQELGKTSILIKKSSYYNSSNPTIVLFKLNKPKYIQDLTDTKSFYFLVVRGLAYLSFSKIIEAFTNLITLITNNNVAPVARLAIGGAATGAANIMNIINRITNIAGKVGISIVVVQELLIQLFVAYKMHSNINTNFDRYKFKFDYSPTIINNPNMLPTMYTDLITNKNGILTKCLGFSDFFSNKEPKNSCSNPHLPNQKARCKLKI